MDLGQLLIMVLAGTVGGWVGLRLSRWLRGRRADQARKSDGQDGPGE